MAPQVLVVDDSVTIRMDLRSALAAAGFNVTTCENVALALVALKEKTFSLLILDVILPDGDGVELLKELRATPEFEAVPIILLTSEVDVVHRVDGLRMGANEYIGKPYDRSYLVLRASRLVHGQQSMSHAGAPESSSALDKKILVVDDSATYRDTLSQMVRRDGCEAIPASSGDEALALLAVEKVDCVILDLMMPGITGMETARQIRRTAGLSQLPIIILTGLDDPRIRAQALSIGVDDYLLKSADLPRLRTRLRGLFRKRAAMSSSSSAPAERAAQDTEERAAQVAEERAAQVPAPNVGGAGGQAQRAATGSLFDEVVAASGLSSVIGSMTLARACQRAGVDPASLSPAGLRRALPTIQDTLRAFLSREEHRRAVDALLALATSRPPEPR